MLEHARQFLSRVIPAPGDGSYLNIHWSKPATNADGTPMLRANGEQAKWWDGRAATTIDEAIKVISWINSHGDKDIYVCMSTQTSREPKTSAKGTTYFRAKRDMNTVGGLRSFYADIDVKEGAYATTGEALQAVKKFITATGLPMPTAVVASGGGGFHVHWTVERDLLPSEWFPLAFALATALQKEGVHCDTQCTVDIVRILRIPGTVNRKGGEARPVELLSLGDNTTLEALSEALEPYTGHTPITLPGNPAPAGALPDSFTRRPELAGEVNADLGTGVEGAARPDIAIEDVARSCAFIARTLGTGGKDNPNPLWFLTAALANFVEDGRAALHAMSDQHPGYSSADTDAMYNRVEAKQKTRDLGWPKCDKIASYGAKECQTCAFFGQHKSPLNFATPPAAAIAVDQTLPDRYARDANGLISARVMQDNGQQQLVPICPYPILTGWLSNNPWTFHFTTKTDMGRKCIIEMPTEVIFAKDGFNKYLGAKGIFLPDGQYKLLKEFFVAWLQKLQQQKDSVISAAPFGWSVIDGKIEGFTYAGRVWMKDSDRPAANPNPVLQFQYTPKGEMKAWTDVAEIVYEQRRPALDAMLAVAFAGPLVRFTGFPGLILNAYSSESGIGKTTAMKVSQSVWGHPVLAMQGLNDTSNSVLGKMGQIRSLPMYWDEIKSEAQVKRFCSIVFDLTGGREKTRMNADATLKLSGTWQTILISASNDTLVDGMAKEVGSTTAGLHRLFEYVVEKPAQVSHDVGAVQRLLGRLEDNYGHAGLTYAKFLGAHWKRVEGEVASLQDELYSEVRAKQEERMWVSTMAVVIKGAEYGNELGLTRIDVPGLRKFMLATMTRMRGQVEESPSDLTNDMSVSSILAEFLNATRNRNTLYTNRIWIAKGKPPKGTINILNDSTKIQHLAVHIGKEDKLVRISSVFLTKWMSDQGYSRNTFIKRLTDEFGVTKVNGKLGGGTEMSSAMEHLIELDANHQKLSQLLDI